MKSQKTKPDAKTAKRKPASNSTAKTPIRAPHSPTPCSPHSTFAAGKHITHPMFGAGVVVSVADEKLEIKFKDGGVKWIIDCYVRPLQATRRR